MIWFLFFWLFTVFFWPPIKKWGVPSTKKRVVHDHHRMTCIKDHGYCTLVTVVGFLGKFMSGSIVDHLGYSRVSELSGVWVYRFPIPSITFTHFIRSESCCPSSNLTVWVPMDGQITRYRWVEDGWSRCFFTFFFFF